MGNSRTIVSRSVFVARLRRAFILRSHPDQFRQHDDAIRKQQSVLLQKLGERMTKADFRDYASNVIRKRNRHFTDNNDRRQTSRNNPKSALEYILEKRDGSILHLTLDLNDSVEAILKNMAAALESCGVAKIASPPPLPPPQSQDSNDSSFHWTKYKAHDSTKHNNENGSRIDHRYDVNSNRGRDLQRFLSSITPNQIEERRAYRMDASAAALVARRLFSFQSIDGIRLGWSSKSFASLLSSLIRLHEEHQHRFRIHSFYPLRLVFSNDEKKQPLDLYEGTIYLNPSSPPLEWLESLKKVTEGRLQELSKNRRTVMERVDMLQKGLGIDGKSNNEIRVKKGFTCSSQEYHLFLERVVEPYLRAESLSTKIPLVESTELMSFHSSVSLDTIRRLRLVVESPLFCRRVKVTNEGLIQVPSTLTNAELSLAISKLSILAGERQDAEQQGRNRCRQAVHEVQLKLGVQKVSRSSERVRHEEFLSALSRLIDKNPQLEEGSLSGYAIEIAASGQFCHLSDDGSFVIPHNWS